MPKEQSIDRIYGYIIEVVKEYLSESIRESIYLCSNSVSISSFRSQQLSEVEQGNGGQWFSITVSLKTKTKLKLLKQTVHRNRSNCERHLLIDFANTGKISGHKQVQLK